MTPASAIPDVTDPYELDREASVLMKRGLAIRSTSGPDAFAEAMACFDRALELRRRLPIATVPLFAYGLAACWLNRAEILMQAGGGPRLGLAIEACDQAIALLRELPLETDGRFARRLAIAHQHRGLALHAQGGNSAAAAFANALAILESDHGSRIVDQAFLLAAVCLNLANARASQATPQSEALARDAARRALSTIAALEEHDAAAAELGLHARHVLCRMVAGQLATIDDVHEATDLVDEGLALVQRWEQRGLDRFRDVALDLFRFGSRVYGRFQPHFLSEFVLENLDVSRASSGYVAGVEACAVAEGLLVS